MSVSSVLATIARKYSTATAIYRHARNWPQLCLNRVWAGFYQGPVRLDSGVSLYPKRNLSGSWGEIFEPAIADVYGVRSMIPPDVIWDVGANIGSFACMAGCAFPSARILSYEPDHDTVAVLRKNLEVNNVCNVTVVPFPVTRDGRDVDFVRVAGGSASNIYGCGDAPSVRMPSRSLSVDGLTAAHRLFVKLDCEGAEGELAGWLSDHAAELPSKVGVVAEYHPWCPVNQEAISSCMQSAGFAVRWVNRFGETYFEAFRNWP